MATFNQIRDYLKTKIGGISSVQEVFKAQKADLEGFPAVCIYPSEASSDFATTTENLREYVFDIRIYVRYEGKDEEDIDDNLSAVVDEVIQTLEEDYTLGGLVDKSVIRIAPWGWEEREQGVLRVAVLKLHCYQLINIA